MRLTESSDNDLYLTCRRNESRLAEIIAAMMIVIGETANEALAGLYRGFSATDLPA